MRSFVRQVCFSPLLFCLWATPVVVLAEAALTAPINVLNNTLNIVPTIRPLALMLQPLGMQLPKTLVPAGVSPHDFSLRASHIRRLREADLVIWLGPELEPYLASAMAQVPAHKQLVLSPIDTGNGWQQHPWTSPDYLFHSVQKVSQALVLLMAAQPRESQAIAIHFIAFSKQWRTSTNTMRGRLKQQQQQLSQQQQGYIVYHDAINGFEGYFGLSHIARFTDANDHAPGAKRLAQIAQLAGEGKVACVLVDHEARHKLIDAVLGPHIKRISIDILALKSDNLEAYMAGFENAMLACNS